MEEYKVTGNYTSHWLSIADSSLTHPKVRYPSSMAATAHFDPLNERLTSSLVYCLNCMFANGSKNQVQLSLQDTRNKLTCEYHCKQKDQQMAVISLPAIVNDVPLTGLTCSVPSGAERTNRTEMTCHNAGQFSSSHDAAFETFQVLLTPEEYRGIAANSTAMVVHNSSDGFRLWRVTSLNSVMHITLYVPQKQNLFGALDLRQGEDADSAPKVLPIVAGLLLAVCCAAFVIVCKYRTLFKREKKHKLLLESNIHSDAFQLESLTGHF